MTEINLLKSLNKSKRNLNLRKKNKSKKVILESKKFEQKYFDGPRKYGYGGYYYDGRWIAVAKNIIKHFKLKKGSKILDVGCGKGFLVKDLLNLGMDAYGVDISNYALKNCEKEVIGRIHLGNAKSLAFPDLSFDAVISINCIYNLNKKDCIESIKEIERLCPKHKSFIQIDSYDNKEEKKKFNDWVLTAVTHFYPYEWVELFKKIKYTGDWYWTKL